MKRKFSSKIRFGNLFLLALGFGLAFYDMNALRIGLGSMLKASPMELGGIAMAIATIANTFALDWGISNGKNKATRAINKKSFVSFLAWVAFGVGYIVIECVSTAQVMKSGDIDWISQIGQYVILTLSYVFSGIAIQKAAREIFDADASARRTSDAELNYSIKRVAKGDSEIDYILNMLENYNQNYKDLDDQYNAQLKTIRHAEDSVVNRILGKTLKDNPSVTPSEARKVVEKAKKEFLD